MKYPLLLVMEAGALLQLQKALINVLYPSMLFAV
jgi:hypothetical protein